MLPEYEEIPMIHVEKKVRLWGKNGTNHLKNSYFAELGGKGGFSAPQIKMVCILSG